VTPRRRLAAAGRPLGRRLFWRAFLGFTLALLLAVAMVTTFVGLRCTGNGSETASRPVPGAPPDIANYARPEVYSFLTLPEWFIVFSSDEYAGFVQKNSPTNFPYLEAAAQYWHYYDAVCQATRHSYPFATDYHVMLGIIGASFTIENAIKSVYENSIGRFSDWTADGQTQEDQFAAAVAREYATFMHRVPWFRFSFGNRLARLWTDVPINGPHLFRKLERRFALSAEYGVKAVYGALIAFATGAYAPEEERIYARIDGATDAAFRNRDVEKVADQGKGAYIVRMPRYEAFTQSAVALLGAGTRFVDIAGNDQVLVTAIAPVALNERALQFGAVLFSSSTLTNRVRKRLAIRVPVTQLHRAVPELRTAGANIEHLYDY
jgi:hypothetical protein